MPRTMVITGAKDQQGLPSKDEDGDAVELVDVHMYNHFYTFQVDRDPSRTNEGVEMNLMGPKVEASTR